ncbi:MAG: preprotein translocase subunit SecE [Solirubrobacteraceae bacterium]
MARDRKRAKQRRSRGGGAAVGRRPASDGAADRTSPQAQAPGSAQAPGTIERADLPGALDHAGAEVDEFDAALIRGAGGVPAPSELDESAFGVDSEDALQEPAGVGGPGAPGGGGGRGAGGGGGGEVERPSGAPLRGGNRAVGFLRASWAELQRVQWPDRRQVTQATAVVLGFVAIAGLYLGAADYVAKEIVEFIL